MRLARHLWREVSAKSPPHRARYLSVDMMNMLELRHPIYVYDVRTLDSLLAGEFYTQRILRGLLRACILRALVCARYTPSVCTHERVHLYIHTPNCRTLNLDWMQICARMSAANRRRGSYECSAERVHRVRGEGGRNPLDGDNNPVLACDIMFVM